MKSDAVVTVRIPATLKQHIEARAKSSHRSLSSQVLHDLATAIDQSPEPQPGNFLGRYAALPLPTDADILEVRSMLWGTLNLPRGND